MNVYVKSAERTRLGFYFEATCQGITAHVGVYSHGLQVVCRNAMHKAWRGMGRHYPTPAAALAHYKTPAMKAIIQAALTAAEEVAP